METLKGDIVPKYGRVDGAGATKQFYSPDQARDANGMWAAGGGGAKGIMRTDKIMRRTGRVAAAGKIASRERVAAQVKFARKANRLMGKTVKGTRGSWISRKDESRYNILKNKLPNLGAKGNAMRRLGQDYRDKDALDALRRAGG